MTKEKEYEGLLQEILETPVNIDRATLPKNFDENNESHRKQLVYEMSISYDRMYRIRQALEKK